MEFLHTIFGGLFLVATALGILGFLIKIFKYIFNSDDYPSYNFKLHFWIFQKKIP